jgi:hypothetical protein
MKGRTRRYSKKRRTTIRKKRHVGGSTNKRLSDFQKLYEEAIEKSYQISTPGFKYADGTESPLSKCLQTGDMSYKSYCNLIINMGQYLIATLYRRNMNKYVTVLTDIINKEPGYVLSNDEITTVKKKIENIYMTLIGEIDLSLFIELTKTIPNKLLDFILIPNQYKRRYNLTLDREISLIPVVVDE